MVNEREERKPSAIYFDFDHTVFDTGFFYAFATRALMEIFGTQIDGILSIYRNSLYNGMAFNPWVCLEKVAEYVAEELGEEKAAVLSFLSSIFFNELFFTEAVYTEVPAVLRVLVTQYNLHFFSEGFPNWQKFKMRQSGVVRWIDLEGSLVAQSKRTKDIVALMKPYSVVVDDNPEVIKFLLQTLHPDQHITVVWLQRKPSELQIPGSIVISRLEQLPAVLKGLEQTRHSSR